MPIIKSAKKALRQSKKREERNKEVKRDMRATLKELDKAITEENAQSARQLLSRAYKKLDKAAKKGVIKKNTASRKKSRLHRKVKKLVAEETPPKE